MFKIGDIVWFKTNASGARPYPNWAGEVKEVKEDTDTYRVKFDPSFNAKEAYLKTADVYESNNMLEDADRLRKLAADATDGQWLFGSSIELAPGKVAGFNK